MALQSVSDASARVRGAYDPEYASSVWACQLALLGEPWSRPDEGGEGRDASTEGGGGRRVALPGGTSASGWPHAPDVWISDGREGESRRLLVNAFSHLAEVRGSLVLPRYPDAPEEVESIRRAYFQLRATEGDWDAAFDSAFFHGDALGVGCVRLGVENRGEEQALVAEAISPLRVLWERTEANPARSPWVAFSILMPLEQAVQAFGPKKAEDAAEGDEGAKFVRAVEYWDVGLGGKAPTRIVWLGDVRDEEEGQGSAIHEENIFGVIPAAFYVHLLAPGMRRPMGRVSMQLATAARIGLLEEMIRRVAEMPPATAIDRNLFEAKTAEEMGKKGIPDRFLFDSSSLGDTGRGGTVIPVVRIPAGELNPLLYQELQALKAQLDAESGVNDYDRGAIAQGQRTATEIEFLNQRTGAVAAWPVKQSGKFYHRFYTVAAYVARWDTEPLTVPIGRLDIALNVPGADDVSMEAAFEDASRVTIEEESLYAGGSSRKAMEQFQKLALLGQDPAAAVHIDARKLIEAKVEALGLAPDLLVDPASLRPPGMLPGLPPGLPPGLAGSPGLPAGPLPGGPVAPGGPPMPPQTPAPMPGAPAFPVSA